MSTSPLRRFFARARTTVVVGAVAASLMVATPAGATPPLMPAAAAGTISGTVSLLYDIEQPAVPVTMGRVQLISYPSGEAAYLLTLEPDGSFAADGIEAGTYRVAFVSLMGGMYSPVREWHVDKSTYGQANTVTFNAGEPYSFGEVFIDARKIGTDRLAGADRYATAAAVAEFGWPDGGGGTVFVVNGQTFPDALSAGAATTNGVLLTVQRDSIPTATQQQLTRIQPDRIVVVGGTSVVSNTVLTALRAYVVDPLDTSRVIRIAGSSRYETSRAVIQSTYGFGGSPAHIFLATGRSFPDALSSVPAAISIGGAVLLVDGSAASLDAATVSLLQTAGAPVTIVGGTGAVSAGIEAHVRGIVGDAQTSRISGSDRFATSVAIAQFYFGISDYAFLANGFGFADALAAGPVAGSLVAPVYLVRSTCMPLAVGNDISAVLANEVVAVGGTSVVSDAALGGFVCP